jgi:hypothetical protein
MTNIRRVSPEEIKAKVDAGSTLLVCAYDNPDKFAKNHLEGALPLSVFEEKIPSLSKDQAIVFYCA